MRAERPSVTSEVELDQCLDQLLATGRWASGLPPGKRGSEIDSLMRVAALILSLTHFITRPRPRQKEFMWASVSHSLHGGTARFARHSKRPGRPCARLRFGSI